MIISTIIINTIVRSVSVTLSIDLGSRRVILLGMQIQSSILNCPDLYWHLYVNQISNRVSETTIFSRLTVKNAIYYHYYCNHFIYWKK